MKEYNSEEDDSEIRYEEKDIDDEEEIMQANSDEEATEEDEEDEIMSSMHDEISERSSMVGPLSQQRSLIITLKMSPSKLKAMHDTETAKRGGNTQKTKPIIIPRAPGLSIWDPIPFNPGEQEVPEGYDLIKIDGAPHIKKRRAANGFGPRALKRKERERRMAELKDLGLDPALATSRKYHHLPHVRAARGQEPSSTTSARARRRQVAANAAAAAVANSTVSSSNTAEAKAMVPGSNTNAALDKSGMPCRHWHLTKIRLTNVYGRKWTLPSWQGEY